jgi:superfamily II DNA/RNA helicase
MLAVPPSLESRPFVPHSVMEPVSFATLGVPTSLCAVLNQRGITAPFPIQSATLPDTLAGRDVLGRGRTGSGKTLAFSLPLVARLSSTTNPTAGARRAPAGHPRALVLAPTRELATQITETIQPLAAAAGLGVMTIFGGVSQYQQTQKLARGVDIVVATPGRLEDLMRQGHVRLDRIEVTVLDEADHMADLGFLPGVTRILSATPQNSQRLLFSATLDRGVDRLVKQFLHQPLVHSVDSEQSPVQAMTHHVFLVRDAGQKADIVRTLASGRGRRLLFTRTKHQARKLARQLTGQGIPAVEMHGNLSQRSRERGLTAFASGEVRVMVATDIAARGIHVDEIELVVHVDPPAEHKAYLHRSGRTARAGHAGDVVTLVLPEQRHDFRTLARAAKIQVEPVSVRAEDSQLRDLVGGVADVVAPERAPRAAASAAHADDQQNQQSRGRRPAGSGRNGGRSGASTSARSGSRTGTSTNPGGRSGTRTSTSGYAAAGTSTRSGGPASVSRSSRGYRGPQRGAQLRRSA